MEDKKEWLKLHKKLDKISKENHYQSQTILQLSDDIRYLLETNQILLRNGQVEKEKENALTTSYWDMFLMGLMFLIYIFFRRIPMLNF